MRRRLDDPSVQSFTRPPPSCGFFLDETSQGSPRRAIPVIGLVGGVASGKSFVALELARLGASILDADRAGHEVLREPAVQQALQKRWGDRVIGADKKIDRAAVGRIVFAGPPEGPRELKFLEKVSHPRIAVRLLRQLDALQAKGAAAAVLDAAVMHKAGWDRICDAIWFVDAPRRLRVARARQRGWTEEDFSAREAAQKSLDEKRRRADVTIDNSGSPEETAQRILELWRRFVGQHVAM